MKIAILGYGRMGKEIKELALETGHEIILTIDNEAEWASAGKKLKAADVAIEFSQPNMAASNILKCFEAGMNDYLPKPIDTEMLYSTLAKFI